MVIDLKLIRRALGTALSLRAIAIMRNQHALTRAYNGRMYSGWRKIKKRSSVDVSQSACGFDRFRIRSGKCLQ